MGVPQPHRLVTGRAGCPVRTAGYSRSSAATRLRFGVRSGTPVALPSRQDLGAGGSCWPSGDVDGVPANLLEQGACRAGDRAGRPRWAASFPGSSACRDLQRYEGRPRRLGRAGGRSAARTGRRGRTARSRRRGGSHGAEGAAGAPARATRSQRWLARLAFAAAIAAVVVLLLFGGLKSITALQPGIGGRRVVSAGQGRGLRTGGGVPGGGDNGADGEGSHGQDSVPQDRDLQADLGFVQAEVVLPELEALLPRASAGSLRRPGRARRRAGVGHVAVHERQLAGLEVLADQQRAGRLASVAIHAQRYSGPKQRRKAPCSAHRGGPRSDPGPGARPGRPARPQRRALWQAGAAAGVPDRPHAFCFSGR